MASANLFWVVVDDSGKPEELAPLTQPTPGEQIRLANGTSCVIDRIDPAPAGAHIVKGTIHVHRV
jgi:hypothetical protein